MAALGSGCNFLCTNPHNAQETWMVSGNTRRYVGPDEYNWWIGLGVTRLLNPPVSAQWFDSIPVSTG